MARSVGSKNAKSVAEKDKTKQFFSRFLSDEQEKALWDRFIASTNEDIAFRAFTKSVEYKRGKPVQPQEHTGAGGSAIQFFTNVAFGHE